MAGRKGSLGPTTLAFLSTLVIMYVVPLPVYGLMSAIGWVEMPDEGTPGQFMISVLVVKIGVALGFVLLLRAASGVFAPRWLLYGAIWWLMFAIVEIGQAIGPNYSIGDAVGGVIAEVVYFPLSSWATVRLLGHGKDAVPSIYSVRHVNIELVLGPIHHGQHDGHDT